MVTPCDITIPSRYLDDIEVLTNCHDVASIETVLLDALREVFGAGASIFLLSVTEDLRVCDAIVKGERVRHFPPEMADILVRWRAAPVTSQAIASSCGDYRMMSVAGLGGEIRFCLVVSAADVEPGLEDAALRLVRIADNVLRLLTERNRDKLTGLLNRQQLEDVISRYLAMPALQGRLHAGERRHGDATGNWLALLDVDRFKSINDRFGHLYGDEVLLLMSQLMQYSFRNADQLFRYGGEEFVILLPNTDRAGAELAFNRFRERIASHDFPQVGQVTVSLGVVELTSDKTVYMAISEADAALYWAKRNGRNRVAFHSALVEQGELVVQSGSGGVELF